jgi:signal transduction histidine kinase
LRRYAVAVGVVACAVVLTLALGDYLEPTPLLLFLVAAPIAAWYGGLGAGIVVAVLSMVLAEVVFRRVTGVPAMDAGNVRRLVMYVIATILLGWQSSANRRTRAALRLIADAGRCLAGSLDYDTRLAAAARVAVPDFADAGVVDVLAEDGSLRCVAAALGDPAREKQLCDADPCPPPAPDARGGIAEVLRTGQAVAYPLVPDTLLEACAPAPERRRVLRALGVCSLLIAPLRARGRTLGVLTLLSMRRFRRFWRGHLPVAAELAQRAALAIDNARLYQEARDMEDALRRRAEQLAAADRQKDEFLAVVAHELRGPLSAMRGALEVLRLRGPEDVAADPARGIITRQVEALARLVDDLLDVARITQGKVELRRQSCDLVRVLHAAVGTVRPLIDERRHTLTLTLPQTPPHLDGDPGRLEQVFVNLLTNAAKYTEPGGHIWLSAAVEGSAGGEPQVLVSVRDTGVGMAPAFLARAFELFTQGSEAPASSRGGLGIGLALVRSLVEMHGGTVEAHSEGPGKGSEFVVRLPLAEDEGQASENRPATEVGVSSLVLGPCRRVLVVDDNADAAESLALLLRLRGHHVRLAFDGPAAVAAAPDYAPDVVLLDLGLPGMDGHEVARRLRQQAGLDKALVVALTGSGSDEDRQRSREAGCDHYLVKPVDWDDLDRLIAGVR